MKNLTCVLFFSFLFLNSNSQLIPTSGNLLWLMADQGVYNDNGITTAADGHLVQVWEDQSGNGYTFRQDSLNQRPQLVYNVLCSRPVLRFDVGRRTFLNSTLKHTGPLTVFIVFISPSVANNPETLLSIKSPGNQYTEILCANHPAYQPISYMADMPGSITGGTMLPAVGNAVTFSPAGNLFSMSYAGGNSSAPASYSASYDATPSTIVPSGLFGRLLNDSTTIGARAPGQNYSFLSGDIAEIIVYNRVLSGSETSQVEGYLIAKYGLFNNCQPLGMQLRRFDAGWHDGAARLDWEVTRDEQVSGYEVEYSTNGMEWIRLQRIAPMQNGFSVNHYQYLHANPAEGLNYYRVNILEQDSVRRYSPVKILLRKNGGDNTLHIFPNPACDFVDITSTNREELQLTLTNSTGQVLRVKKMNLHTRLDLRALPAGIYYLSAAGTNSFMTEKVIKK